MALEKEAQSYARELPNLVQQIGKFVLIQGDSVVGIYSEYQDAINAGYDKFGIDPFMVKKIQAVEQVHCFTRNIFPCHI